MKLTTVPGEKKQGHNELNAVFILLKTITQIFFIKDTSDVLRYTAPYDILNAG
jgi:hypothetical protein